MSEIIIYPDTILRTICEETTPKDFSEIRETLLSTKGAIGLAAPQIGLNLRVFMINYKGRQQMYINPLIRRAKGVASNIEGCLSIPKVFARVYRDDIIYIEYYDEKGTKRTEKIRGFESAIFQHELDHLDGKLFIDHVRKEDKVGDYNYFLEQLENE